ncbi:MAG: M14 family metallopeptidase [Fusicatenibacter sp.]|nr:M14 family metallopeptidase [Lachnospiraceae bacterium]MDY2937693.1 M14 family metallopeptidase [Fusicatenibacter sp.]
MIETVAEVGFPVDEVLRIQKQRLRPVDGTTGKRISIVTGIHGDELEGQYVCYEVARRIGEHPEYLHGIVDIYPALNPFGIDSVTRGIPAFDLDMNRIFPGREDGDMNEYVASKIIEDLEGSDLCLDIHASNIYLTEIPQIRINEEHTESLLGLGKLANVDFLWVHSNSTVLSSTLAYSLNSRKVPTLVVEMGVGMRITREYGDQLTDGIFKLMEYLGIWEGPTVEVRTPIVSSDPKEVEFLNAPVSGIFMKTLSHGALVKKGMEIGQIVDPLRGIRLCTVEAPADGWLFTIREYPVVDEGSLLARILKGHDAEAEKRIG